MKYAAAILEDAKKESAKMNALSPAIAKEINLSRAATETATDAGKKEFLNAMMMRFV